MKRNIYLLAVFIFFSILNIGFALDWKNLHQQADKKSLAQALKASKDNPQSMADLYILGLVNLNLHNDKQADENFKVMLNLDPQSIEAKWGIAEVFRRKHDIKQSVEMLNEIIKNDPQFSPAYITLAYLEYRQMNFNQAVNLALKVIQQGRENVDLSNYTRAYLILAGNKGMISHYGGPLSKIINGTSVFPTLKKALRLQPDSAQVFFGLGSYYLLAPKIGGQDLDKAFIYLEKAVEKDPNFADFWVRLAQAYKMKGDLKKYQQYLDRASQIDPQNELVLDIKSGKCKFICVEEDK